MAYQAHVEAEWNRLKQQSLSINQRQEGLAAYRALMLNAQQSRPISLKPGLNAGQDMKQEIKVIH